MENYKKVEEIPVVFSVDGDYIAPLGAALVSILANKQSGYKIIFFILSNHISEDDKRKLMQMTNRPEASLQFLSINKDAFKYFPEKKHLKESAYYRLLAPLLVNFPKIIYLDCDLIVRCDLRELYNLDLQGKVVGAVRERTGDQIRENYFRKIDKYFNSGVLVIDAKKWRSKKIWERAQEFINSNHDKIKHADQDVLNHLLENEWLEISKFFNFQLDRYEKKDKYIIVDIKIMHFVGESKPWHYLYRNGYQKYFLEYLKASPWSEYQRLDKNFLNFIKKHFVAPLILVAKNVLKIILPARLAKILKNISYRRYWRG